jgi:hypothetical protein
LEISAGGGSGLQRPSSRSQAPNIAADSFMAIAGRRLSELTW